MNSMFDIFKTLPLFKGISDEQMQQVIGKTKFHFFKYLPETEFIREGDPCTAFNFILEGSVKISILNSDKRFKVTQVLKAPDVIFPDFMFGLYTDSPGSVMSIETTKVLQISKADYVNILRQDSVFLLNYLNMLSVNGQKSFGGVLALTTGSIEERIAFWVVALTQGTATEITIECRQRDLYSVFGVQRTSFISALESMKNRGLIDFMPDRIIIKNRRDMVDVLRRIP